MGLFNRLNSAAQMLQRRGGTATTGTTRSSAPRSTASPAGRSGGAALRQITGLLRRSRPR